MNRATFSQTLARARTFGFLEDVERLRAVDLIRGGSLDNAIVLTRDGILNGELRYPDEFGRHKTLDLIGDLALIGRPLLARVVAHKAGHALHTQLVSRLLADPSLWTETSADAADVNLPSRDAEHPQQQPEPAASPYSRRRDSQIDRLLVTAPATEV